MGNSKIRLGTGETLIDLTNDTVTAATLLSGITAHGKDGESITGSFVPKIAMGITPAITAGQSSVTIRGIVDANGDSFTPTGCALLLKDSVNASHDYSYNGMVGIIHGGMSSDECTRLSVYGKGTGPNGSDVVNRVRSNTSFYGFAFGDGYFTYTQANAAYQFVEGTYLWIAWALPTTSTRRFLQTTELYDDDMEE